MGDFSNTVYRETTDSLIKGMQNRLDNPYYLFSDKKPTPVTYWNVNIRKSTLDQGSKQTYDQLGDNSPLRFNRIDNFHIYGIDRILVDYQVGDFGVESDIEGEGLILPNTVIPCADDYFCINYVKDKAILFRVQSVTIDTLESGANFYKIRFALDKTDEASLDSLNNHQLVDVYEYVPSNVGSNFVAILRKSDKDLVDRLDSIYSTLKKYFVSLFYKKNIQTFIYEYKDMLVYDPYLIEFIIRTELFNTGDYLYISQAVHKPTTFAIEYDHTIFRNIENRNHDLHLNSMYPVIVHDPNSLLVDRLEDYYELSINLHHFSKEPINNIDMDLFDRIVENNLYSSEDPSAPIYRNIIIGFMNNDNYSIDDKMLDNLLRLNYRFSKDLFYEIPILMYIIRAFIFQIQQNPSSNIEDDDISEECYMTRK